MLQGLDSEKGNWANNKVRFYWGLNNLATRIDLMVFATAQLWSRKFSRQAFCSLLHWLRFCPDFVCLLKAANLMSKWKLDLSNWRAFSKCFIVVYEAKLRSPSSIHLLFITNYPTHRVTGGGLPKLLLDWRPPAQVASSSQGCHNGD